MSSENLLGKIENYFLLQKELGGDILLYDKPEGKHSPVEETIAAEVKVSVAEDKAQNNDNETISGTISESKTDVAKDIKKWEQSNTLDDLYEQIHNCKNCALGETRNQFVFGTGNPNADLVIIGEAPGADEDAQGKPFVGRAGKLLTKILESVNLSRDEVFICNILK
nr:uracil-DNA glycosylase [Candidatus Kapabacteria bacterium]